jgi:hypothetical protein
MIDKRKKTVKTGHNQQQMVEAAGIEIVSGEELFFAVVRGAS